jgi:glutathionylspermidine synthase
MRAQALVLEHGMQRVATAERQNLDARIAEYRFSFHTADGVPYWDESAYYSFTLEEIERDLEAPANELAALCRELVGRIHADEQVLRKLAIPQHAWDMIAESWRGKDASLYGRFDFAYDGRGPAKLLEYNADTPTALYEAAVFQWVWLEDAMAQKLVASGSDQFNSLHEKLIARLKAIVPARKLHLAGMLDSEEDACFLAYLEDCAMQAGLETNLLAMTDIGNDAGRGFVDLDGEKIQYLFKLYPWEWIFADKFGASSAMRKTRYFEPPWKALLSNKGILPLLWKLAPNHPNLLPAFFEDDPEKAELGARFVKKPIYSREGANVLIVDGDKVVARAGGDYGEEGYVRQALAPMPQFSGKYPVIGAWIVGEEACGIGIREDDGPITQNLSRFVPHAIIG